MGTVGGIVEAVDRELEAARVRVARLEALRTVAEAIEDGGANFNAEAFVRRWATELGAAANGAGMRDDAEAGPVPGSDPPSRAPAPDPPKASPRRRSNPLRERILEYIRAHPGKHGAAITREVEGDDSPRAKQRVGAQLRALEADGVVGTRKDGRLKLYTLHESRPSSQEAPPTRGADPAAQLHTDTERAVVELVRESPRGMTAEGISIKLNIPTKEARWVASTLARRGVLAPRNGPRGPVYEMRARTKLASEETASSPTDPVALGL